MKKLRYFSALLLIMLLAVLCAISVSAAPADTAKQYDPAREGIVSSYYTVLREQGYITGITPGTTSKKLQHVCLPSTSVSGTVLGTGTVVSAGVEGVPSLTAIVTGDLNGDGGVTITDMLMLKSALLGETLSAPSAAAGDLNYDSSVTITDFLQLKSVLLGYSEITSPQTNSSKPAPMLLMTPSSSQAWEGHSKSAVSFLSGDETVATVDEKGVITAHTREGSAFVYALDHDGKTVDRIIVTVLSEKLAVSFDEAEFRMTLKQTQSLSYRLNHPVDSSVSWQSSDSSVVSVSEDGTLTSQKVGSAVITAALPNGSTAKVTVLVAPPITELTIQRSLHKIKPGQSRSLTILPEPDDPIEVYTWKSSDPAVVSVNNNGTVTGNAYGIATVTVTGKFSGLSASCTVKVCDVKQVAITFDDGPSSYTGKLLDFLKENDIKATFFVVGERLSYYEDTLRREVNEGHEIGYHSYDHQQQTSLTSERITYDFERSNAALQKITGASFTLWRTPGGGYSSRVLSCVPLPHILWSVDTLDWKTLNSNSVYKAIMNNSYDGAIILLHDLHRTSVEGAIWAMQDMLAGDYEFLTVTELLSRDGTPPEKCQTYLQG